MFAVAPFRRILFSGSTRHSAHLRSKVVVILAAVAALVGPCRVLSSQPGRPLQVREVVRIDGEPLDLHGLEVSLAIAPNGDIAAFNPATGQILVFDDRGALRHRIGRSGSGPGEFARSAGGLFLIHLGFVGDTLIVIDRRLQRVSAFSPQGKLLSTTSFVAWQRNDLGAFTPSALLRAGRALGVGSAPQPAPSAKSAARDSAVLIVSPEGTVERSVAHLAPDSNLVLGVAPVPFRWDARPAFSSGGLHIVTMSTSLARGTDGVARVSIHSLEGSAVTRVDVPFVASIVSSRMLDSALARLAPIIASKPGMEPLIRARVPRYVAPFQPPVVGDDGTVWLPKNTSTGAQREFVVVAPTGSIVGLARIERPRVRLLAVRSDVAWVVETNEDGFKSIVKYTVDTKLRIARD